MSNYDLLISKHNAHRDRHTDTHRHRHETGKADKLLDANPSETRVSSRVAPILNNRSAHLTPPPRCCCLPCKYAGQQQADCYESGRQELALGMGNSRLSAMRVREIATGHTRLERLASKSIN